jgi:hypothetical protein
VVAPTGMDERRVGNPRSCVPPKVRMNGDMVVIESRSLTPDELRRELGPLDGVDLDVRPSGETTRFGVTEVVLVALISASAQMLSPLVTGLVNYLTARPGKKMIIKTDAGDLEVPASASPEQVARLIERLSQTKPNRIIVP